MLYVSLCILFHSYTFQGWNGPGETPIHIVLLFRIFPHSQHEIRAAWTPWRGALLSSGVLHWNKKPSEKVAGQPLIGFNSAFKVQGLSCFSLVPFQFRQHGVFIFQYKQVNSFKFEENHANWCSQWCECKGRRVGVDKALRFIRTGQQAKSSAASSFSTPSDHFHQLWTYHLLASNFFSTKHFHSVIIVR